MSEEETFPVEVAYALPEKQSILVIQVSRQTTMLQAAKQSKIDEIFPEIDWSTVKLGVFGELENSPETRLLEPGDRIEIYRPLTISPMEIRRIRAAVQAEDQFENK